MTLEPAPTAALDGHLVDQVVEQLLQEAATFAQQERAENTRRGYASDMTDFSSWCSHMGLTPLPASPTTVAAYLAAMARAGAAPDTMSRRLSSIRHYHLTASAEDPTADPGVRYVLTGIRKQLGRPPEHATPLMPPLLFDVLAHSPTTHLRAGKPEPSLSGARDRALIMVGFVGALRRSEISAIEVEHFRPHPNGLVLEIPHSKTNQDGRHPELVVLPRSRVPDHCPVTLLQRWLDTSGITNGPVFRAVSRGNRTHSTDRPLTAGRINQIVQDAVRRAGVDPEAADFSAANSTQALIDRASLRPPRNSLDRQRRDRSRPIARICLGGTSSARTP